MFKIKFKIEDSVNVLNYIKNNKLKTKKKPLISIKEKKHLFIYTGKANKKLLNTLPYYKEIIDMRKKPISKILFLNSFLYKGEPLNYSLYQLSKIANEEGFINFENIKEREPFFKRAKLINGTIYLNN
jgi:hypothetical protein